MNCERLGGQQFGTHTKGRSDHLRGNLDGIPGCAPDAQGFNAGL